MSTEYDKVKEAMESLPFMCFVEQQSGLLVLISHSGYCLKFQLETKLPVSDQLSEIQSKKRGKS